MEKDRINKISRSDVFWNFGATFLKIASSILLLPAILKEFSSDLVAIWSIFSSIGILTNLLDFGFNSSFVRTVTYIFSGSNELKTNGFQVVYETHKSINYGLLKGTIDAMRWFYSRVAFALFLLLSAFGTIYILHVLKDYDSIKTEVIIAWAIFIINNTITLYTLYYESLMQGRGYIRESKQIIIIAHLSYLILAYSLVLMKCGIISLVSAQVISVIIIRVFSNKIFFDSELKEELSKAHIVPKKEIIKIIYPNALKMGLTQLGSFLTSKSSIFLGSLYLSLNIIASYSITMQIFSCVYSVANIYMLTYIPKITQARIHRDILSIKAIIKKSLCIAVFFYLISTIFLCVFGPKFLEIIHSNTILLDTKAIIIISVISFLEMNHAMAASILLTKNYVPFFKPSLYAGIITVILLTIFLKYTDWGVWGIILAPGIAQVLYQNWKWPFEVYKDFRFNI